MKKILLLLGTSFFYFFSFSQDKETEAQFYFTQAETYYDQSKFIDAFNALVECEKLLAKPNSKILYLKIKSHDKILTDMESENQFDTGANMRMRRDIKLFFEITDVNKYPKEKYFEIIEIKKRVESITPEQYLDIYIKTKEFNNFFEGLEGVCPGRNCLNKIFSFTRQQSDYGTRRAVYQTAFYFAVPDNGDDLSIYLDTLLAYFNLSDYAYDTDYMNNVESIRSALCEYISQRQYEHRDVFNVFMEKYADLADEISSDEIMGAYINSVHSFFHYYMSVKKWYTNGSNFERFYYNGMKREYFFGKIFYKIQQRGYLTQLLNTSNHPNWITMRIKLFEKNK